MRIHPVTASNLIEAAERFPEIGDWTADFCAQSSGKLNPDTVWRSILNGSWQGHLILDDDQEPAAFFCTTVLDYPGGARVLEVTGVGGAQMERWDDDAVGVLVRFALAHGCSQIEAQGRMGWLRQAKARGFKTKLLVELDLGELQ